MIEPMKKLEVIVEGSGRDRFVGDLQKLGLVHLETTATGPQEDPLAETITQVRDVLSWVTGLAKAYQVSLPQAPLKENPGDLAHRLQAARKRLAELVIELRTLDQKIERLTPYGRVDPEVLRQLDKAGLALYLCSTDFHRFHPDGGPSVHVELLHKGEEAYFFLALHLKSAKLTEADQEILTARDNVEIEDLRELEAQRNRLAEEQDGLIRGALDAYRYEAELRHHVTGLCDTLRLSTAQGNLDEALEGVLWVVRGWFPAAQEPQVAEFFQTHGEVYFIDDPAPEDDVPVKLKQSWFTRLFEPITRVYGLPNYRELDTTPFFAPFYALFFGLCVADAGYALLILVVLLLGSSRLRKTALAPMVALAAVLATTSLVGGIVLDDFFGVRPVTEGSAGYEWLKPFAFLRLQNDAMAFPILLGFLQIGLGYLLRTVNRVRHSGWTGALMSLGVLTVIASAALAILMVVGPAFTIGPIPVGRLGTGVTAVTCLTVLGVGLFLILFFNGVEHGTKWYLRPLHGLWNVYELVTGLPGDILSYLRLFALGLAGGLLAEAVNEIAFKMVDGSPGPLAYLAMAAILVVGHGLNLGIGLLSAFVHSLRLTFVEFYKAVEFKGGGRSFEAFRIESTGEPDLRLTLSGHKA